MLDVVLGGAIGGIVGARAYFVLLRWDYYGPVSYTHLWTPCDWH